MIQKRPKSESAEQFSKQYTKIKADYLRQRSVQKDQKRNNVVICLCDKMGFVLLVSSIQVASLCFLTYVYIYRMLLCV